MEAYIDAWGLPNDYNCNVSNRTIKDWYTLGANDVPAGVLNLIYWAICETLYIPCVIVLLQKDIRSNPVYKLMLVITCCDMYHLTTNSLLNGIFLIRGAVFCTNPNLFYIWGSIDCCVWSCCCSTCFLLAFTRLIDLIKPKLHEKMFAGSRIFVSLTLVFGYMMAFLFFSRPILFNSLLGTWIFDPLIVEDGTDYKKYDTILVVANNFSMVTGTIIVYCTYFILLIYKINEISDFKLDRKQKQIVISTFLICFNNFVLALMYALFMFIPVGPGLVTLSMFTFKLASGAGIFVYYVMNKTIRNRIIRLFGLERQMKITMVKSSRVTATLS